MGAAAGAAQGPVGEVGVAGAPAAEAGRGGEGGCAGGDVRVGEGHEVGADGGGVGLVVAREGEGAGDEDAGGGVPGGGWLVRVERAAVVFWGAEMIAVREGGRRVLEMVV